MKPLLPQKYTQEVLTDMAKKWTSQECFAACDMRMRFLEKQDKESFVERGIVVMFVEQNNWFAPMYPSVGAWLTEACPYSRSTAYAALGEVKRALADGVSLDDANKMPRCNLKIVNRLSTSVKQDPEILAAAKTESENGLIDKVRKKYPNQHMEPIAPMRFRPDKSQRATIDTALQAIMMLEGLATREEALEGLASDWLISHQDEIQAYYAENGDVSQTASD